MNQQYVNLARYPIDAPASAAFRSLVGPLRENLITRGLINLEEFLTREAIEQFRAQVYEREPSAHHSVHGAQGYFDKFPGGIPAGVVGSDTYCLGHHLLRGTAMDALYRWQPMLMFVAAVTGNDQIYLHEDPSNALKIQLYKPGSWTGWHFDRAGFTTIINLGEATDGGVLECVPDVRTETQPGYDEVREVLYERSNKVQRYRMTAGSLTLMLGRYSLHRVTTVGPGQDRISLVLCYETQPGVSISAADRQWIFGPNAPGAETSAHIAKNR